MFGTQAMRLLRTMFKTPTLLAQELFAMFQSDIPLSHDAPITINYAGNDAPLKLDRGFSDGPMITMGSGGTGGSFRFGDTGDLVLSGPRLAFESVAPDGKVTRFDPANPTTPKQQQQASTYPGQVVSGDGTSYRVKVYFAGTASAATEVSATALGLADDAQLDVDSWQMVSALQVTVSGQPQTQYYFVPLAWGADL